MISSLAAVVADTYPVALAVAVLDIAALGTVVPTDNPYWAAAIVQVIVVVVMAAKAALAMEADLMGTVVLAVDIVTCDKSLLHLKHRS